MRTRVLMVFNVQACLRLMARTVVETFELQARNRGTTKTRRRDVDRENCRYYIIYILHIRYAQLSREVWSINNRFRITITCRIHLHTYIQLSLYIYIVYIASCLFIRSSIIIIIKQMHANSLPIHTIARWLCIYTRQMYFTYWMLKQIIERYKNQTNAGAII